MKTPPTVALLATVGGFLPVQERHFRPNLEIYDFLTKSHKFPTRVVHERGCLEIHGEMSQNLMSETGKFSNFLTKITKFTRHLGLEMRESPKSAEKRETSLISESGKRL